MELRIDLPDELAGELAAAAEAQLRTPEAQAAWILRSALKNAANGAGRQQRLARYQPVLKELRELHLQAGKPSIRDIAERTGLGRGPVHLALSGTVSAPSLRTLDAMVRDLGGDTEHFRAMWIEANR